MRVPTVIPDASEQDLLDALERFDLDLRHTPEWLGWEERKPYKYAILYGERHYPAKAIIALATGVNAASFRGGRTAHRYLARKGFLVVNLDEDPAAPNDFLASRIAAALEAYEAGAGFSQDHPLWRAFEQLALAFHGRPELRIGAERSVSWFAGRGRVARVPWLAFVAPEDGAYTPVLLFRRDQSGCALALVQGFHSRDLMHAEPDDCALWRAESERRAKGLILSDDAEFQRGGEGLVLDGGGNPFERAIQASCLAYTTYEADALPSDAELLADLEALFDALENLRQPPSEVAPDVPRVGFERICDDIASALIRSHIRFGAQHDALVRRFVSALAAKRFAILTGLSGSGKTQLALRFGDWLGGSPRRAVIAVRPDWTGPDALLGYEDALLPASADGARAWHVPEALAFMLRAARAPTWPHLLVLDEMNLAHVERYFADVLSGMESELPVLPNLARDDDGLWRTQPGEPERIPVPSNLFVVGTVNVDETTYMFSPKVLDRANTLEFRVHTEDLSGAGYEPPAPCAPGHRDWVQGFLAQAVDARFHLEHPAPEAEALGEQLRRLHALLSEGGFEFGHRVFHEAMRFAAYHADAGEGSMASTLDAIAMLKLLPRLHGSRRRLEGTLCGLARFAWTLEVPAPGAIFSGDALTFDPLTHDPSEAALPMTAAKLQRMTRNLRANQFASFAE